MLNENEAMTVVLVDLLASLKARAEDDVKASLASAYSAGFHAGQANAKPTGDFTRIAKLLEGAIEELADLDEIDTGDATECEIPEGSDSIEDVLNFCSEHGGQTVIYKDEVALDTSGLGSKLIEIRVTLARVLRLVTERGGENADAPRIGR